LQATLLILAVALATVSALESALEGQARQNPDVLAAPSGFPAAFAPAPAFFYRQFPDPNTAFNVDPAARFIPVTAGVSGNVLGFG
jgi:hypothetical protein